MHANIVQVRLKMLLNKWFANLDFNRQIESQVNGQILKKRLIQSLLVLDFFISDTVNGQGTKFQRFVKPKPNPPGIIRHPVAQ